MTTDADRLRTMYALLNESVERAGRVDTAWLNLALASCQDYRLTRPQQPTALDVAFGASPTVTIPPLAPPPLADGWWVHRGGLACIHKPGLREDADFDCLDGNGEFENDRWILCRKHAEEAGAFQVGALPTKERE